MHVGKLKHRKLKTKEMVQYGEIKWIGKNISKDVSTHPISLHDMKNRCILLVCDIADWKKDPMIVSGNVIPISVLKQKDMDDDLVILMVGSNQKDDVPT